MTDLAHQPGTFAITRRIIANQASRADVPRQNKEASLGERYAVLLAILFGARVKHWLDIRRKRRALVDAKPAVATAYRGVEPPQTAHETGHQRNT